MIILKLKAEQYINKYFNFFSALKNINNSTTSTSNNIETESTEKKANSSFSIANLIDSNKSDESHETQPNTNEVNFDKLKFDLPDGNLKFNNKDSFLKVIFFP